MTEGQRRNQQVEMVAAAIRHPIRVRALEWMNNLGRGRGRELSASVFINQGLGRMIPELMKPDMEYRQQVSLVSYHLKELESSGAIHETRSSKKRGRRERFYRAHAIAYFSDVAWAETELEQRQGISRVVAQGLVVQIEGAIFYGTFDSHTNRWLLWEPKDLDPQGWSDMATAFATFHALAMRIGREAAGRIEAAGEEAKRIPTTVALLMFESPPLPDDPSDHADDEDGQGGDAPAD